MLVWNVKDRDWDSGIDKSGIRTLGIFAVIVWAVTIFEYLAHCSLPRICVAESHLTVNQCWVIFPNSRVISQHCDCSKHRWSFSQIKILRRLHNCSFIFILRCQRHNPNMLFPLFVLYTQFLRLTWSYKYIFRRLWCFFLLLQSCFVLIVGQFWLLLHQ
jgi:hypothetical protein